MRVIKINYYYMSVISTLNNKYDVEFTIQGVIQI